MVLKRKFSILFALFACLLALVGLTSCGETEPENKLSEHEQALVTSITTSMIKNFKDPASFTVISIEGSWCDGALVVFTVSAKNSFGGTNSTKYYIPTRYFDASEYLPELGESIIFSPIFFNGLYDEMSTSYSSSETKGQCTAYGITVKMDKDDLTYSVANVNAAINEYKTAQGWA